MTDGISPVHPVSRIEPVGRVRGISDMDPGLYQATMISLFTLFQKTYPKNIIFQPGIFHISTLEVIQPAENYKKKKKYSKKNKKEFKKISAFIEKRLDQDRS